MTIVPLGDSAVLARVVAPPEEAARVLRSWIHALDAQRLPGVLDLVPSYATLAIFYDPAYVARERPGSPFETVRHWAEERIRAAVRSDAQEPRTFMIPVCYGGEFGPDLPELAQRAGLAEDEFTARHAGVDYEVRAVGFTPGFPYLAGLPPELGAPRRATPRVSVPAGSVAIGGAQSGIYSLTTPGGWNVIGRTPWRLFAPEAHPPALLRIGDRVRFQPMPAEAFASLEAGPLGRNPEPLA